MESDGPVSEFDSPNLDVSAGRVVVLSGAHDSREWAALTGAMASRGIGAAVWDMPSGEASLVSLDGSLGAFIDRVEESAEQIALIGVGVGGGLCLRAAALRGDGAIDAVVAISTPRRFCGADPLSEGVLRMITRPKLMIASEFEDAADDVREIFAVLEDPRQITLYPGGASGTAMLAEHEDSMTSQLVEFVEWAFAR